jgi:hypothetical protein
MKEKEKFKENFRIFLKSAFFTAEAILLVIIGFLAAGYLFGK